MTIRQKIKANEEKVLVKISQKDFTNADKLLKRLGIDGEDYLESTQLFFAAFVYRLASIRAYTEKEYQVQQELDFVKRVVAKKAVFQAFAKKFED